MHPLEKRCTWLQYIPACNRSTEGRMYCTCERVLQSHVRGFPDSCVSGMTFPLSRAWRRVSGRCHGSRSRAAHVRSLSPVWGVVAARAPEARAPHQAYDARRPHRVPLALGAPLRLPPMREALQRSAPASRLAATYWYIMRILQNNFWPCVLHIESQYMSINIVE